MDSQLNVEMQGENEKAIDLSTHSLKSTEVPVEVMKENGKKFAADGSYVERMESHSVLADTQLKNELKFLNSRRNLLAKFNEKDSEAEQKTSSDASDCGRMETDSATTNRPTQIELCCLDDSQPSQGVTSAASTSFGFPASSAFRTPQTTRTGTTPLCAPSAPVRPAPRSRVYNSFGDCFYHDPMDNILRPQYAYYNLYSCRLESFSRWPIQMQQLPENMAKAGFFYEKIGDSVTCFHCGQTFTRWQPYDNPLREHRKLAPHCSFAKAMPDM
jgi:hypothetical protein